MLVQSSRAQQSSRKGMFKTGTSSEMDVDLIRRCSNIQLLVMSIYDVPLLDPTIELELDRRAKG